MREYLSMMLVPVKTLLAGTAEPCCRKAWALTGGLGKVFAGRSNSGAEFILFLSTLLASTFRRQREDPEYIRINGKLLKHRLAVYGHVVDYGHVSDASSVTLLALAHVAFLSRDYTLVWAGENIHYLTFGGNQISAL